MLVKHFELAAEDGRPARRLETRLLVVDRRGSGYGVTYRWRADGSDAELLTEGLTEEIDLGDRKLTWTYPSRNDCLTCHTANAGFVLGVNTRQLNHPAGHPDAKIDDNLLRAWNRAGFVSARDPGRGYFCDSTGLWLSTTRRQRWNIASDPIWTPIVLSAIVRVAAAPSSMPGSTRRSTGKGW